MSLVKITRPQEEIQTLKRFIENQGDEFISESAIQDRSKINEPSDASYCGVEYQITYGDRNKLSQLRKSIATSGSYLGINSISEVTYAQGLLEDALTDKKTKSDNKMTLLIDCTYTSYGSFLEREGMCKKYFMDNEKTAGGSWQHIFVVFPDGNVQLR